MSDPEKQQEKVQLGEVKPLESLSKQEQIKVRVEQKEITLGQALIELAYTAEDLFVTESTEVYATVKVKALLETLEVKGQFFKDWLRFEYYILFRKPPSQAYLQDAIDMVVAQEVMTSVNVQSVFLRYGEKNGKLYIDLADHLRQAVEISENGWKVLKNSEVPVKFIRTNNVKAMPTPDQNGQINDLKSFVNVKDGNWVLLLTFILACFRPSGPYPLLIFQGGAGTGKSTHSRVLKKIVDPQNLEITSLSKNEEDLLITAKESALLAFDNLSGLDNKDSDNLCKLATGSGFVTRKLFSNGTSYSLSAMRPCILNGIDYIANRADLASRSIIIYLPRIGENRKAEREFWIEFERKRPSIFGALCNAMSGALKELPSLKTQKVPRMADYAYLGIAAEKYFGFTSGTFIKSFEENQREAARDALEESTLGTAIKEALKKNNVLEGTAQQIISLLKTFISHEDLRGESWQVANRFKSIITRLQPILEENGINYEYIRKSHGRIHRISKIE